MVKILGEDYSRNDLAMRLGHLSQLAGIRMMELRDGSEAGVRIAEVRTGSGLRFQVSLDRGMDVSVAEYKGIPLAWRSPAGDVNPRFYDPRGLGWLRSFPGGLMTGCGLSQAGAPSVDEGEELGLHGRLSHLPAFDVRSTEGWNGEHCTFRLEGFVREYSVFGVNLLLHRTIETSLGSSQITFRDVVKNEGTGRSPIMMLYHINLGWPLLDKGGRILLNAKSVAPRDAEAQKGLEQAKEIPKPIPGFKEQVFQYDLNEDREGLSAVLLENSRLDLGFGLRFRKKELPKFNEWKMTAEGMYVLGLEPANCHTKGRAAERAAGTLQFLEPGEEREFVVQTAILEGEDERTSFIKKNELK